MYIGNNVGSVLIRNKALRHFYRCEDCLTVAVTQDELPRTSDNRGNVHYGTCDGCGGEVEYIGPVKRETWMRTEYRCACDGRCTGAAGPSCDCECGGENHGTGAMVEVIIGQGKLPRVMTTKDAAVKGEQYRALLAEVRAAWDYRYGAITRAKRERYLDGYEFDQYMNGQYALKQIGKARNLRTYGGRQKRLAALLVEFNGKVAAA